MDFGQAGQFVVVMLAPTLLVGAGLLMPRAFRAVRRFKNHRRVAAEGALEPTRPPIEQLAADLRRLLQRHETLKHSPDVAMRGRHLRALEAAISDCATDAALALGLPPPQPSGLREQLEPAPPVGPDRRGRAPLPLPELRRLLWALAGAGLVLTPAPGLPVAGLMASDDHR